MGAADSDPYDKEPNNIIHAEGPVTTMPVAPQGFGGGGPSCFDRVKMGFMIGFSVGMASGALFGGFSALRYGYRGRELLNMVGKTMVQGGGTFGTFMAVGTGIRC